MAFDEFIGCLLTSFGIPIVLVLFTIISHPLRIITLIISSSFWLVAFLFSSIIWFAVVPLRDKLAFGVVFSVLLQELLRVVFIYCLHKIDRGIKLILSDLKSYESSTDRSVISNNNIANTSNNVPDHQVIGECVLDGDKLLIANHKSDNIFNVITFAYVGGLGFGIISGLFATLNMLVALYGPGTLGYNGESPDFINFYAAQTLLLILIHTAFHVIMMRAFQNKLFVKIAAVVIIHMLFSCLTLANKYSSPVPETILGLNCVICVVSCCWAFIEAGGRFQRVSWAIGLNFRRLNRFLMNPNASNI